MERDIPLCNTSETYDTDLTVESTKWRQIMNIK